MTFDARKGSSSAGTGNQNMLFAGVTLAVVCGAFFAVLALPTKSNGSARLANAPGAQVAAVNTAAMPRLPGEQAEAYFVALGRVDAEAQAKLSARITKAGRIDDGALAELVMEHAGEVLKAHASELALADTKHVDHLLDLARDRLRSASRKRSKWCEASRYAELQQMEFQSPAQLKRELAEVEAPMREFAFEALTGLMVAVEDARVNPVQRGELTRKDEAALQGMMMSLMTDPDVMPLMISLQSGADAEKALKGVNICELAATAVAAAKTLPQDTKGRILAEAMDNMDKNGMGAFSTVSF